MDIKQKVGGRINFLRNQNNLSQKDFGSIFGVDARVVSHWEGGKIQCPYAKIIDICDYFRVDPNFIFCYEPVASKNKTLEQRVNDIERKIEELVRKK